MIERMKIKISKMKSAGVFFLAIFFAWSPICGPWVSRAQQEETREDNRPGRLLVGTPERAGQIIDESVAIVKDMVSKPDKHIPPEVLRNAAGVAVVPNMLKAGFVPGGRRGEGVLLVNEIDLWSPPVFLTVMGGNIGAQIGVTSKNLVFVFTNRETIEILKEGGSPALGLEVSMAAGPSGMVAGEKLKDDVEILAYSRSEGGFEGISLTGGNLALDRDATLAFYEDGTDDTVRSYYGKQQALVNDLLDIEKRKWIEIPESAENLREALANYTSESTSEPSER